MLSLRKCLEEEKHKIQEILTKENITDLCLKDIVYVGLENEELFGVIKAEKEENKWILKYLVIIDDKRGQNLGDALLRSILNYLYSQGVHRIYFKSKETYFLKKGFSVNNNDELELNIPDFFSKGCNSCGGCNEVQ
ncbi:GNAT family N-acetyltransferase [Tissierella pigra]|uniref:GNAT family N-acetyltransferase n=1 Tax=Tissierella pigra TaxID=2607614 RepID=UPI001C1184CE|nr:GNAT family N-acetyltransferase [Tissierella pigra]MBU5426633.1 GNAT family N-acetyltransferase [Tissierella pigra]